MAAPNAWLRPDRRARELLRTFRLLLGETRDRVAALEQRVDALAGTLTESERRAAERHGQLLEVLHFIHEHGSARRAELRRLRASALYTEAFDCPEPLVSVVIPTYDNVDLLRERSLPSVLAQSYRNLEVIVVGDAAGEQAREAVQATGDPRVRFVDLPYRGPYPADPARRWYVAGIPPWNEATALARGAWVAPHGDDDAFRPSHVEQLLELARRERLELAYGRLEYHLPDGTSQTLGAFPPQVGQFGLQGAIYHRGLAEIFELELSDGAFRLPGDWGLCLRMLEAGVRMGMLAEVVTDYYPSQEWRPRFTAADGAWEVPLTTVPRP